MLLIRKCIAGMRDAGIDQWDDAGSGTFRKGIFWCFEKKLSHQ
jgi:hypothetical protein